MSHQIKALKALIWYAEQKKNKKLVKKESKNLDFKAVSAIDTLVWQLW